MENSLGKRIKALREQQRLTQAVFGKRIGLTAAGVQLCEKGTRKPSLEVATRMAKEFSVSMDYLILGTSQQEERFSAIGGLLLHLTPHEVLLVEKFIRLLIENREDESAMGGM